MKNKCFSVVCIFLLILSFFTCSVFAVDTEFVEVVRPNGNKYSVPISNDLGVDFKNGFVYRDNGQFFVLDDDSYFYNGRGYSSWTTNYNCIAVYGYVTILEYNGSWVKKGHRSYDISDGQYICFESDATFYAPFYSNKDKQELRNEGNANPFVPTPQPTTLAEIMEVEKTEKKTIQEILGVLPLILVVVVSFLGLRKALKMLSTFLNRS